MTEKTKEVKEEAVAEVKEETPEQVQLDQVVAEEVNPEQTIPAPESQEPAQPEPETMEIVIIGKENNGKVNVLSNIIKDCLERDYTFRTYFEGMRVQLRQLIDPNLKPNE